MTSVSNGNKITVTVATAGVVTVTAVAAGAYLHDTTVITGSLTAFFGFLGGLVMGKYL